MLLLELLTCIPVFLIHLLLLLFDGGFLLMAIVAFYVELMVTFIAAFY